MDWQPYAEGDLTQEQVQLLNNQINYQRAIQPDEVEAAQELVSRGLLAKTYGDILLVRVRDYLTVTTAGRNYLSRWIANYTKWLDEL